jgi:hypothetical protein
MCRLGKATIGGRRISALLISMIGLFTGPSASLAAEWNSVLNPRAVIAIRGRQYVPESAFRDWSIQQAGPGDTDVTRFEVRTDDQWDEDRSSGERKERSEFDGYKTVWTSGMDVWSAYSFLVEPGPRYHSDWSCIGQMHAAGRDVKPLHIHFNDEKLSVFTEKAVGARVAASLQYTAPLSRNDWHHVVFHVRQDPSTNGRLEFWLDGSKVIDYSGGLGSNANYYWKFGIYRGYGPIAAPLAVRYANMEIGAADLSARIATPLPVR